MIVVDNVKVFNWEGAIRGARNPMNSWLKSDSFYLENGEYHIGNNDLDLLKRLVAAGSDERKFMRQILVSLDITAPFYWWKGFDTYKVGTTANSCSTMHKIHTKRITPKDFSCEKMREPTFQLLEAICDLINYNMELYVTTNDKTYWEQIIQILPTSYNQKRTITLNYEVLRNIYHARKHHKLDEWKRLCDRIEELPYSELITMPAKVAK